MTKEEAYTRLYRDIGSKIKEEKADKAVYPMLIMLVAGLIITLVSFIFLWVNFMGIFIAILVIGLLILVIDLAIYIFYFHKWKRADSLQVGKNEYPALEKGLAKRGYTGLPSHLGISISCLKNLDYITINNVEEKTETEYHTYNRRRVSETVKKTYYTISLYRNDGSIDNRTISDKYVIDLLMPFVKEEK